MIVNYHLQHIQKIYNIYFAKDLLFRGLYITPYVSPVETIQLRIGPAGRWPPRAFVIHYVQPAQDFASLKQGVGGVPTIS